MNLAAPFVATGRNKGVFSTPWAVFKEPALAPPETFSNLNMIMRMRGFLLSFGCGNNTD
jgi:hypothetical protein